MSPPAPAKRNAIAIASAALFAVSIGVFLVHTVFPAADRLTNGFLAYYVAGESIKNGQVGTSLYDDQSFSARVRDISGGRVTDIYLANPPTLAVAWVPFAQLSVEQARHLWVWLSVIWLAIAVWLITAELPRPWRLPGLGLLTALFTLAAPAREQFVLGQMYSFILLLHVIGWRAYSRRQDAAAGMSLGFALALKLSGWPIGVLMLAQRRWRAVCAAIATGLIAAALTLPWVGLDAWRTFILVAVPRAAGRPSATLSVYQDTGGFWQHWLRYDAHLNPQPLFDAPGLASILTLCTAIGACVALLAHRRSASISFAAAVTLVELLSPAAEQYHYIVMLLPLSVLWYEGLRARCIVALLAAGVATLLIAWPMNYKAPHPGWAFWLSYPRLIGGWIVFTALLASRIGNRPADDTPLRPTESPI